MNGMPILSVREALLRTDEDFYTALYWRQFPIAVKLRNAVDNQRSGFLCSFRMTSSRPRRNAAGSDEEFRCERFLPMVDAAAFIAGNLPEELFINRVRGGNSLFALLRFPGNVVAEIELNETLPDTMPDIAFIKGYFQSGCVTNQPLVGFLNEEGILCADGEKMEMLVTENSTSGMASGVYEWMKMHFRLVMEKGTLPKGKLDCEALDRMILGGWEK